MTNEQIQEVPLQPPEFGYGPCDRCGHKYSEHKFYLGPTDLRFVSYSKDSMCCCGDYNSAPEAGARPRTVCKKFREPTTGFCATCGVHWQQHGITGRIHAFWCTPSEVKCITEGCHEPADIHGVGLCKECEANPSTVGSAPG
jgi:hypothetical protein